MALQVAVSRLLDWLDCRQHNAVHCYQNLHTQQDGNAGHCLRSCGLQGSVHLIERCQLPSMHKQAPARSAAQA